MAWNITGRKIKSLNNLWLNLHNPGHGVWLLVSLFQCNTHMVSCSYTVGVMELLITYWSALCKYVYICCSQVLLFHDQSYGIHYEYTVSLNTSQDSSSEEQREQEYLYIWTHSSWQDCTVQCGGGKTLIHTYTQTHIYTAIYVQTMTHNCLHTHHHIMSCKTQCVWGNQFVSTVKSCSVTAMKMFW